MYKVGDKVRFTFLGLTKNGEIIDKYDNGTFKVESEGGTKYPSIRKEKPSPSKKRKTKDQVLGWIIEKL